MNIMVELKSDDGKLIGTMTAAPKQFKTGSSGFYASGKLEIDGKRYQVQVHLVQIGSKPAAQQQS